MRKILFPILLAALVFALYAPALRDGFVWDDTALVRRDPLIRSWRLIPEGFQHFLFIDASASDFYRPIQRLNYTLDYGAFDFRPGGYHFTNIVCHIAAALAFLLLAHELLGLFGVAERKRQWIAFLAALAWAIHPVHSAAVVYISGRADPLAAAFGFLGLFCGLRSLRANRATRWLTLIAAGVLFLLSILSKETGAIFPFLFAAIICLQKRWKEFFPLIVLTLFVGVIYLTLRLPAEHVRPPTIRSPAPLLVRPILAARAFAEYTGLILLPLNLHMDRDVETHPEGVNEASVKSAAWRELQTLLGILLIAAGLFWLWRSRKQDPAIFCCLLLAAIAYLPISGIFLLNASIAEHWLYLPTAFLFLAGGLAISRLSIRPVLVGSIFILWLIFLGARTWMRTFDWRDPRTFLERNIANGGDSARMLINLGGLELSEGHFDSAKKQLQLALRKEPDQPLAVLNLAAVALRQNDFASARAWLDRATKLPLVEAQAYELLAVLEYKQTGQVNLLRLRLASRTGQSDWAIEKRYVEVLAQSGAINAAIAELKSCLTTQWYRAESWQLLSRLLAKAGNVNEAAQAKARAQAYDVHLMEHPSTPATNPADLIPSPQSHR
ncbi:MAG TPA: tetratricopeptide repeat protein [Chthoniobacterales bacterium]